MDYVVFGIGFGATLLVLGLLFRDLGPRVRFRRPSHPDGVFHAEELVARVSWSRFCVALGTVLAIAGVLFIILTAVCMMLMVSDGTAGAVMLGSLALLCVLMALWTWAFFDRFGSYGILPERDDQPAQTVTDTPATVSTNLSPSVDESDPADHSDADDDATPNTPDVPPTTDRNTPPGDSAHGDDPSSRDAHLHHPVQTPEERMASSASPLDHESLEDELDMPVRANHRPGRRDSRQPASATPSGATREDHAEEPQNSDDQTRGDASGTGASRSDKPDARNG